MNINMDLQESSSRDATASEVESLLFESVSKMVVELSIEEWERSRYPLRGTSDGDPRQADIYTAKNDGLTVVIEYRWDFMDLPPYCSVTLTKDNIPEPIMVADRYEDTFQLRELLETRLENEAGLLKSERI